MPEGTFVPGGTNNQSPPFPPFPQIPPPPYPPPPYLPPPGPPGGGAGGGPSGMDIAVFICGVVGLVMTPGTCCCSVFGFLPGFLALMLGLFALIAGLRQRRICREEGREPHGLLTAGWIIGLVVTILSAIFLAILTFVITMYGLATLGALSSL